jgi:hypothetical protein
MFGTIRRHQKWLWIVISTVTIVSFVAFFSPNRRRQGGWTGPRDYIGSINGRPITRDEYASAYREARLNYAFSYGDWSDADARQSGIVERQTRERLFLIEKLRDLNIQVPPAATAQWILDEFRDRTDKSFRKDSYDQFTKAMLPSHGLAQADFERFAQHQVGLQHLITMAGTSGKLVTPQEAESLFRQENEEAQAEAAFISSSNYLAQVMVNPADVAAYYTNQQAVYRVPERMVVSYVKFAESNYVADADQTMAKNTNLNQTLEAIYLQRGTNSFKDANNVPLSPEAAKEKIREEERQSLALQEAKRKAVGFANELFEMKEKTNSLEKLAAAKGLVSEVTEPFTQFETAKNLNVPSSFAQAAFKLTPDDPVAEPIDANDGVYIIEYRQKIPSEVPTLDRILDRVTQDYRNSKALDLAHGAGLELQGAITNAMAAGKTFQAAVVDTNASTVVLSPFKRNATTVTGIPVRADVSQLVSTAFTLTPGKVSSFVPTRTGGFVVCLKTIDPVPDDKMKTDLPEFIKTLRQRRQVEAFSEWFRKQMELARIDLPGERQRASAN